MQEAGVRQVKKQVYFDVRSICLLDDETKQKLVDKGLVNARKVDGDVVNMGIFRRYIEDYLSNQEGSGWQHDPDGSPAGGNAKWCAFGTVLLPFHNGIGVVRKHCL